jgi:hypothetical protein
VARFDRTVPAGGEGKITLVVKTKGYQRSFHKTAVVTTNDPKHPRLLIGMKGHIWTPIEIEPRDVHLNGILGEEIEQVVHLRRRKEEPLMIELALIPIPDKLAVELHETKKGCNYQLRVRNKVEKHATYVGRIKLTTNYPEMPEIVIPVTGNVRPPIEVWPRVLSFGSLSEEHLLQLEETGGLSMGEEQLLQLEETDGLSMGVEQLLQLEETGGLSMGEERWLKLKKNIGPPSRSVMVLLNDGDKLQIKKVELENSIYKVQLENAIHSKTLGGRSVKFQVEAILENLKKGTNEDCLKIYTNQKGYEVLKVPIRFRIFQ